MTIRESEIIAVGNDGNVAGAVSWAAVIAGAVGAVATTLILLLVGSGLGLTMVSPWSNAGVAASTFAVSSILWLVIVQWLSSALGGYLAGRLRTRWAGLHGDEVTFRDTAHGFLAWALGTIIIAAMLTSAVGAIVGGTVQTAATVASGAVQGAAQGATLTGATGRTSPADPTAYFVDALFRPAAPTNADAAPASGTGTASTPAAPPPAATVSTSAPAPTDDRRDVRGEATRILVSGFTGNELAAPDKEYLAQLVAGETGMNQADAEKRVNDVLGEVQTAKAKATEAADQARKASATLAILMALSLLVGGFIASVAAVLGGKERDAP